MLPAVADNIYNILIALIVVVLVVIALVVLAVGLLRAKNKDQAAEMKKEPGISTPPHDSTK